LIDPNLCDANFICIVCCFATFAIGSFLTPYDATSGLRGLLNGLAAIQNDLGTRNSSLSEYYGYWAGVAARLSSFGKVTSRM
jgi:hypothetical protein